MYSDTYVVTTKMKMCPKAPYLNVTLKAFDKMSHFSGYIPTYH